MSKKRKLKKESSSRRQPQASYGKAFGVFKIILALLLVFFVVIIVKGIRTRRVKPQALEGAPVAVETTGRVLRMSPEDEQELIEWLEQHTQVRFEVVDPIYEPGSRNFFVALRMIAEVAPKLPGYEGLSDRLQEICVFVREQLNPIVPESERPYRIDFGISSTKGKVLTGELGYYAPRIKESPTGDGIVWYDYSKYASPDIFMPLMIHELDHALVARNYKANNFLTTDEMVEKFYDPEFKLRAEASAWSVTVEFFDFLLKTGGLGLEKIKRPLVDLLALELLIKARLAFHGGDEGWKEFLREHTVIVEL